MIRVTGINLLTYINWICDDISHTRFLSFKKRQENGEGASECERKGEERKHLKGLLKEVQTWTD